MTKTYRNIYLDLLVIFLWIIITFIFAITPILDDSFVRIILGIPVALFIPGYIFIAALFPKRDDIEIVDRITMSIGVSIAILSIIGLLLNFIYGIRLMTVLIILYIYMMIFMFVVIYRRRGLPEDIQFSIRFDKIYAIIGNKLKPKNKTDFILTIILIFMLILTIGTTYYAIATPKMDEIFTEFYILNSSGKANNYPVDLNLNSPTTFMVGVVNHEYSFINYTAQITLDKNILTSEELILNHNEIWKENLTIIPDKKGNDMKLEFLLFKEDNFTIPYRSLYLWVNVT